MSSTRPLAHQMANTLYDQGMCNPFADRDRQQVQPAALHSSCLLLYHMEQESALPWQAYKHHAYQHVSIPQSNAESET